MGIADNSEHTVASANTSVKYHFGASGVDSETNIYFSKPDSSLIVRKVVLRTDNTVLITHINERELKDPITVTTSGFNPRDLPVGFKWTTMVVKTQLDSTSLKLLWFGA